MGPAFDFVSETLFRYDKETEKLSFAGSFRADWHFGPLSRGGQPWVR
jgi:hypothetical protein